MSFVYITEVRVSTVNSSARKNYSSISRSSKTPIHALCQLNLAGPTFYLGIDAAFRVNGLYSHDKYCNARVKKGPRRPDSLFNESQKMGGLLGFGMSGV